MPAMTATYLVLINASRSEVVTAGIPRGARGTIEQAHGHCQLKGKPLTDALPLR